jgi:hypothetical protein
MGVLDYIDEKLGTRLGLLMSDPRAAMEQMNRQAGAYNQASLLAIQAERNALRGLPVTPEQAAAKQYVDKATEDVAMGFAGTTIGKGSFKYPQEEALQLAQQRAALPISKGGLGLPVDNTAMDRAKAMGFNIPVYHGTNADITAMNTAGKGKTSGAGAFVTNNPIAAETYLGGIGQGGNIIPLLLKDKNLLVTNTKGRNWNDIDTNILKSKQGDLIDVLGLDRNAGTSTDELAMLAKDVGFSGIKLKNIKDLGPNSHVFRAKEYLKDKYNIYPDEMWSNVTGKQFIEARDYLDKFYKRQKSDVTAINDADLLRSRFAAFDPFRKTSAIAATMGLAAPDLLAGEVPLGLLAKPNLEITKKEKRK